MLRLFFGVIAAYFLLLPALWLLLLWLRPLWLLQISQAVRRFELKLKPMINLDLPVRRLLLLGLFHSRPRILDAWVEHHLVDAREHFANRETVARRKIHVATPASIDDQVCESLSTAQFQGLFEKPKVTALIVGEGGAGKTSMACRMAMRAMADEPDERLCKSHRMLPVLIESNLEPCIESQDALLEAIHQDLRELVGEPEPIFEELLIELLRDRRVLVIIDGLSESDEITRQSVRPARADFPAAALIVTSRVDENLGGATKTTIRLPRLQSSGLAEFMDRYLKQSGKRSLFDDSEYFIACSKLCEVAGDREITPLITRMYADQMIAAKEAGAGDRHTRRELPCNLPDLMLGHLRNINDQVQTEKLDLHQVINAVRITAWECLKQTCRSTGAKRSDVLEALRNEAHAESLLKYLEERLRIIQTTGEDSELIRFSLDPLAEYLAALYLVERYGQREDLWLEFIERAREQQGMPEKAERIKDFLLAVRDCCMEKGDEYHMSEWIKDKLVRLSGLDPAMVITAQIKQRVNHWIANLKSTSTEDRRIAAQTLGTIGPRAKEGVPALIIALKDREAVVRHSVVYALAQIGAQAVPALITALKDRDTEVRRSAASALGQIGPPIVPALIIALKDQEAVVRSSAASVLGQIGPEAKEAVSELIAALIDRQADVRRAAASALGQIGPKAHEAVAALTAALADEESAVRRSAAEALGKIGPEAKEGIPTLIIALTDQDTMVRRAAASALGQIGPTAVPALITALKDQEVAVRGSAAFALGQIEPKPKEAVPVLITALTDQNAEVWRPAASALGRIGPEAKEAVPALITALKDQDEEVRRPAAEALGKIGPAAVPALINALKHHNAEVRSSAVYALWQIGPGAKEAVPALILALKDQDAEVRSSVATALSRIGAGVD